VLAGGLLCFGRRAFGLLPSPKSYDADLAARVSPSVLAGRPGLPPMLLLSSSDDQIVPCAQTERFAEAAHAAKNDVAALIFEGETHGSGGWFCEAGREAVLEFMRYNELLLPEQGMSGTDPTDAIGKTMRALNLAPPTDFPGGRFRMAAHRRATLRLRPLRARRESY